MTYSDEFLDALGRWQRGWREDSGRRSQITADLIDAIHGLPKPLPMSTPLTPCYRKRFLVPANPQNGGDFFRLVMMGEIPEGVASWTFDPLFHNDFKELVRGGATTALFRHTPPPEEVVVDIVALWDDPDFVRAVDDYVRRGCANAETLQHFRDGQKEIILDVPLRKEEVVGLVGLVSEYPALFAEAGASSEEEQDELHERLCEANIFPGQARWVGGDAARRALDRVFDTFADRLDNLDRGRGD